MKLQKSLLAAIVILICGCAPQREQEARSPEQSEGGFAGNGIDDIPFGEQSAWFTGQRPIYYCVLNSEQSGLRADEARTAAESAFATWKAYAEAKKLEKITNYWLPNGPFSVYRAFSSQLMEFCSGSEDLRIYFGARSGEVNDAIKHYRRPIGFAHRTHLDPRGEWSKGFIWIRPIDEKTATQAQEPAALIAQGILLHELGHVFGNGHVPGTIMDPEHLLGSLSAPAFYGATRRKSFTEIDQSRELLACDACPYEYSVVENKPVNQDYEKILGRKAEFPVRKRLVGTSVWDLELIISDARGEFRFPLRFKNRSSEMINFGSPIFQIAVTPPNGSADFRSFEKSTGFSLVGSIDAHDGRSYTIFFSRNMRFTIDLQWIDGDAVQGLFTTPN